MLARATSSDDSPTPGYMYGEIAKMTHASFDACKGIEEYLIKRVASKNANVKRKALMVIKQVSRQGRPEFRRDMCRMLGPIKECLSFSGPPDPLRGDEAYYRVREAAKEALEAVTSSDPIAAPSTAYGGGGHQESFSSGGVARFEGYGTPAPQEETFTEKASAFADALKSKALSAVASVAGPGTNAYVGGDVTTPQGDLPNAQRMAGMGNPDFAQQNGQQGNWSDSVASMSRRAGTAVRNLGFRNEMKEDLSAQYGSNRGPNAWPGTATETGSYDVPRELRQAPQQQQESYGQRAAVQPPAPAEPAAARQRGAVGGSWGAAPTMQAPPQTQQQQQGMRPTYGASYHQQPAPQQGYREPSKRAGEANRDGEYERQLVVDLCAAGGTRAAPPAEKLAAFVEAAKTLEVDVVGPNVLELLDDDKPWQVKCKALALVEALAKEPECEAHKAYFAEVAQDLAYLADRPPVAVQKNARAALKALGLQVEAVANGGKRAPRRAQAAQDADFADVNGGVGGVGVSQNNNPQATTLPESDEQETAAAAAEELPPPPQEGGGLDLLGGYDENGFGGGVAVPPALTTTSEMTLPPEASEPSSLFGDMQIKDDTTQDEATTSTFAATTTPPPPPPMDPFASVDVPPPAATSASSVADPFAEAAALGAPEDAPLPPLSEKPAAAKAPPSAPSGGDPFAALTGLEETKKAAPAPATGPAFLASTHATPAYQQQQMLQQQQAQMQAQMVALMRQQQMLATQARQYQGGGGAGYPPQFPAGGGMAMSPPSSANVASPFGGGPVPMQQGLPPPSAVQQVSFGGSGFDFMAGDSKAKQADSFSFVNDMMK